MAITLKKRIPTGRELTTPEVDNNWALIEAALNSAQSSFKRLTGVTLLVGTHSYNHAIGKEAAFVNFFKADGTPTDYYWVVNEADSLNKIDITVPAETPGDELLNTKINIQAI